MGGVCYPQHAIMVMLLERSLVSYGVVSIFSQCLTQGKGSIAQSPETEQLILAAAVNIQVGLCACLGDLLTRTSTGSNGRQSCISQRTAAL